MIAPVFGVLALLFAFYLIGKVNRQDAGTDRMREIAAFIHEGARAFLMAEYRILVFFVAILFILIGLGISWLTAYSFLVGAVFSTAAGFIGMNVATRANVRTAAAAKDKGMNAALSVAFSGGAVMGMSVVGFGLVGSGLIYFVTGNPDILSGFSLGASSIALFARVGGGIYTKAADVGADLVGKVEAGIPEDDPRNPAVIADNVGDNVGDVAGMGADLFESYVGSIVSAITLGVVYHELNGAIFPLLIAALGIAASILGCFFVKGDENSNPHKALKAGSYSSAIIVIIGSLAMSWYFFHSLREAFSIIFGLVVGLIVGGLTGFYGGVLDEVLMRIADSILAFPSILLALVMIAILGKGKYNIIIALGILFVPSFARIVRTEVAKQKNTDYVRNARLMGASNMRILFLHIMPNIIPVLLSSVAIGFNNAVLSEASMSYLGVGVQPPDPSLGRLLSEAQGYLFQAPWYAIFTGVAIILLILGFSLLADGMGGE